jgi:mannan endo-1,4-beta-mannosidase
MDIYAPERQYASQQSVYYQLVVELKEAGTMKIIALTENGVIPDIDNMREDKAIWSHWSTWNGEFVIERGRAAVSSKYTEEEQVKKVYNSEYVVTLNELSDSKAYPIDGTKN